VLVVNQGSRASGTIQPARDSGRPQIKNLVRALIFINEVSFVDAAAVAG
jgi:hypothetical protein